MDFTLNYPSSQLFIMLHPPTSVNRMFSNSTYSIFILVYDKHKQDDGNGQSIHD